MKISKGWLIVNIVLVFATGGVWLIPLGIYAFAKLLASKRA